MAEHTSPGTTADAGPSTRSTGPTLWVGWIYFAAMMMIMLGAFNVIEGLVALFNKEYYLVSPAGLLVFNLTAWGWIHLIIGALAVVAGAALFTGALWARIVAVILAGLSAIAELAFLSAYPIWAVLVITLDVLVIWAIVAHGREMQQTDW